MSGVMAYEKYVLYNINEKIVDVTLIGKYYLEGTKWKILMLKIT